MNTEDLVRIGKDYFKEIATQGAKAALVSYFPFLAVPPMVQLLDMFLKWLIGAIADHLENAAFFTYTDFRVSQEGKRYVQAKLKGYQAEINGSIEEINRTKDEIKAAFRAFAKFN